MMIFDKRTAALIVLFTLPLLFFPKINLVRVGDETAGIRIDDLVLLLLSGLLFWAVASINRRLSKIEWTVLAITGWSLLSFFSNLILAKAGILEVHARIFYSVRLLEYFMFFYVGAFVFPFISLRFIFYTFFALNACVMTLQKLGIIGGFSVYGYVIDTSRIMGIASFPSEMGLILNILFAAAIFDESYKEFFQTRVSKSTYHLLASMYPYALFLIFSILCIWTANRISLLALVALLLAKTYRQVLSLAFHYRISFAVVAVSLALFTTYSYTQSQDFHHRSNKLASTRNFAAVNESWNRIDLTTSPMGQEENELAEEFDMSLWMRLYKWAYAAQIYLKHPECYLQGIGPGFNTAALDGGYLRILTETGLVGLFLYGSLFLLIFKQDDQLKWMIVAAGINMITFDVYLAYKPMSLLFLSSGYFYAKQHYSKPVEPSCAS